MPAENNFGNLISEKMNIDCDVLAQSLQAGNYKDKSLQKAHKILTEKKFVKKGISKLYPLRVSEIDDYIYVVFAFSYGEKEIPEEILYELVKTVKKTDIPSIQFNGKSPCNVIRTKLGIYAATDFTGMFEDNINSALYNSDEQIIVQVVCAPKNKKSSLEASAVAWAVTSKNNRVTEVYSQFITDDAVKNLSKPETVNENVFISLFNNIFNP